MEIIHALLQILISIMLIIVIATNIALIKMRSKENICFILDDLKKKEEVIEAKDIRDFIYKI